jgi:fumarylacetoacetase
MKDNATKDRSLKAASIACKKASPASGTPAMIHLDDTHHPARTSWVESANHPDTDFPIQNLPIGIFSTVGGYPRAGMAIGDFIFDIGVAHAMGWLTGDAARAAEAAKEGSLNKLFALGRAPLKELRWQVSTLLDYRGAGREQVQAAREGLLHVRDECTMHLPVHVGNYTDFYAGIYHACAACALLTPEDPLPTNYQWVPIGYHGRASSVRASGGMVRRPHGQLPPSTAGGKPAFGPSQRLDFDLEMGFYVGAGNAVGEPIAIGDAHRHIVGYCLLNDWSARDVQRWEMLPFGPFLSKSFGVMVSPWVVLADALLPFRVPAMRRDVVDPAPLEYLVDKLDQRHGGINIALSVGLQTAKMRRENEAAVEILQSNARHLYWTPGQMLAHHTVGGCNLEPGDLIGTGTISGPTPDQLSSMQELTFSGEKPVSLPNGEQRGFLENGDEVVFTGKCHRKGFVSIGFGEVRGRIEA